MPHHEMIALVGVIRHVFAHRFTVEAGGKTYLADLGPKGAEAFPPAEGLKVRLKGEQRPSEIKVAEIAAEGSTAVAIHHKKPHHSPGQPPPHHRDAGAAFARRAVSKAGWTPGAEPRRKPQHYEVLARQGDGPWSELHVDLEGAIHKVKPVPANGGKWADDMR